MTGSVNEERYVDVKALAPEDSGKTVNIVHGTFRCRRGYDLYTTTYLPAVRRADACLVFHHGLADHSERHGRVLAHLCASIGMPVYTYDVHGHGRSGPAGPVGRALILSYTHLVDDLLDFTRQFVTKAEEADGKGDAVAPAATETAVAPGQAQAGPASNRASSLHVPGQQGRRKPRIFLLGYSMGGLASSLAMAETCPVTPLATSAKSSSSISTARPCNPGSLAPAASSRDNCAPANGESLALGTGAASAPGHAGAGRSSSNLFAGLMLTSCLTDPLYGNHPLLRAIKVAYVTVLSWLTPAVPLFKRNPVESGIRDPAAARAMADDMLWYRGRFKVATVASLLAACARLRKTARRLSDVPLYVQHATVDMSCSLPSMHAFLARVRPSDLTMHVVEGAYHDLHHDPETPMLLGRMMDWLRERI
ncbi:hypothetical protein Vafri_18037 [Volvox africanus]|uniref:Serine aminopeptidase S33 domain-containing protein n=1 Tax=Volvox africanus TaxID=51714 RepID=A0A8J4BNB2_9CHLO|nr:hypothetical protein Vafri_18037 [Volvox africanus]